MDRNSQYTHSTTKTTRPTKYRMIYRKELVENASKSHQYV